MELEWLKACLKLRSLSTFLDKRETSGQFEYLAQWSPSLLDQIDIKRRKDGREFVEIGNHILDVKLSVYKGAFQAWVYWENTWLPRSTALELFDSEEDILDTIIFDKPVPLHGTQRLLEDRKFIPKARGDYTCSFLRKLKSLLPTKQSSSRWHCDRPPVWTMALGMEFRRPVVFTQSFCDRGLTVNLLRNRQLSAMALHIVGMALRMPCTSCIAAVGPFSLCVVDPQSIALGGDCTNCAFLEGRVASCSLRQISAQACKQEDDDEISVMDQTKESIPVSKRTRSRMSTRIKAPENPNDLLVPLSVEQQTDFHAPCPSKTSSPARKSFHDLGSCTDGRAPSPLLPDKDLADHRHRPSSASDTKRDLDKARISSKRIHRILRGCDPLRRAFYDSAYGSWKRERRRRKKLQPFGRIEDFLQRGYVKELLRDWEEQKARNHWRGQISIFCEVIGS